MFVSYVRVLCLYHGLITRSEGSYRVCVLCDLHNSDCEGLGPTWDMAPHNNNNNNNNTRE